MKNQTQTQNQTQNENQNQNQGGSNHSAASSSLVSAASASPGTVHSRNFHTSVAWPVHTPRLTLRPATAHDADATWEFRRLPEVSRWLTRETGTLEEYRDQFLEPESLAKTAVIELEGHVIGDLMLDIQDAWAQTEVADRARATQGELGWVLHPHHTGRGYATEAVRALLDIAFHELGLRRVTAACFAANDSSWRLMERVGMRRETYNVRDSLHRSGDWLDGMVYALLAHEHHPASS